MPFARIRPKVYIVDDSLIFRAMLETMVAREPGFEICGIAASADQALAEIGRLLPDIILLDLNFRHGMSGLEFLDEIEGHWHHMDVIIVSTDARRGSDVCRRAFAAGAVACFDKAQVIASGGQLLDLMHGIRRPYLLDRGMLGNAISLPGTRN